MPTCAAVLLAALLLTGCAPSPPPPESNPVPAPAYDLSDSIIAYTDPATGCDYLIYAGYRKGGITPRMMADGRQVCVPPTTANSVGTSNASEPKNTPANGDSQ
jgi:hypothetical protein